MFWNWKVMFCNSWSDRVVLGIAPAELGEKLNNMGGWFSGVEKWKLLSFLSTTQVIWNILSAVFAGIGHVDLNGYDEDENSGDEKIFLRSHRWRQLTFSDSIKGKIKVRVYELSLVCYLSSSLSLFFFCLFVTYKHRLHPYNLSFSRGTVYTNELSLFSIVKRPSNIL